MPTHPTRIGPYRVLRPIASGGMAEVFEVADEASGEHLALKLLVQTHAGGANAHQQQMFDDSLRAALTLDEVRSVLKELSVPTEWVTQTTDRHWTICGRKGEE